MAATEAVANIKLSSLSHIASGKVRELYDLSEDALLFVATDRTSAYDVILANGVPGKGVVLNLITAHWFRVLSERISGLRTHLLSLEPPACLTAAEKALVAHRSMQVRKLRLFPVEVIVRGYVAGSAWKEYERSGTIHGIAAPPGLSQCSKLPRPLYTPSTKAEAGAHDENISPEEAARLVGNPDHARRIEELALALYEAASDYAAERGIIIADTKFEFGLDEATGDIVVADEVLTPDSSRFWPADKYKVGRDQESFDKQFIRNWLTREGLKGKEGVSMPEDITRATAERYHDVFKRLTGKSVEEALQIS